MRSRYFARYISASASLTQASPRRSTLNAYPSPHSCESCGSASRASRPAMNLAAIDWICEDIVLATSPFASPPALSIVSMPGGSVTPGCER